MESEALCTVCFDMLDDPVILDCSHNVCYHCAEHLHDVSRKIGSQKGIQCPVCRAMTIPPENSTDKLRRNITLRNIVEQLKDKKVNMVGSVLCGWCESAKAEVQCMDCKSPYCEACRETTHSRPAFRNHKVVPISESSKSKEHTCKEHQNKMDLFCLDCSVAVCSHCLLVGSHQGHKCASVREMATQAEQQLADRASSVETRLETLKKVKAEVDHIRPQVESEHEALQAQLYVQFSALQSAVERRRQELLEAARRLKEYKISVLESQSLRLEGLIQESNQGLRSSERILTSCTEMEIVQFSVMVQGRLEKISQVDIPSEAATDSSFSADFKLDIMKMIDQFGHVDGLEEIPEGLFLAPTPEEVAEAKATAEEEEDEEGKNFVMSKAKAEAIARAARAAVDRAQAKAGGRVVEDTPAAPAAEAPPGPPPEAEVVGEAGREVEAKKSEAADTAAAAGGPINAEIEEPVASNETRESSSGSVVEYGGFVLPSAD